MSKKKKRTIIKLDDLPIHPPKKPRVNGAGYHAHHSDKRKKTREAKLRAELDKENYRDDI